MGSKTKHLLGLSILGLSLFLLASYMGIRMQKTIQDRVQTATAVSQRFIRENDRVVIIATYYNGRRGGSLHCVVQNLTTRVRKFIDVDPSKNLIPSVNEVWKVRVDNQGNLKLDHAVDPET